MLYGGRLADLEDGIYDIRVKVISKSLFLLLKYPLAPGESGCCALAYVGLTVVWRGSLRHLGQCCSCPKRIRQFTSDVVTGEI